MKDYLWLNLRDLPYFRSLLRAVEARFYQDFELCSPILDIGCGDGHFASIAFDQPIDVGLDPWGDPIREAAQRGAYHSLVQAEAGKTPFPECLFWQRHQQLCPGAHSGCRPGDQGNSAGFKKRRIFLFLCAQPPVSG